MNNGRDALHRHLAEQELLLLQPGVRASVDRLDALIADDFREIGASGRQFGKDEAIMRLPAESGVTFAADDLEVRLLGAEVALVTYRAVRSADGRRQRSLRSSLWRHDPSGWRMVFHQGTPLPDGVPL